MYPYAALMQAAQSDTSLLVAVIALITTIGGSYTFYVKRLTDSHFTSLEGMRMELKVQDGKLSEADRRMGLLQGRLDAAAESNARQKKEYDSKIEALEKTRREEQIRQQGEINALKTQLAELNEKYSAVVSERDSLQVALKEEQVARASLQTELTEERNTRQRFQEELTENHGLIANMQRKIKVLEEKAGIREPNGDDDDPPPTEPNDELPPAPPQKPLDADGAADNVVALDAEKKDSSTSDTSTAAGTERNIA